MAEVSKPKKPRPCCARCAFWALNWTACSDWGWCTAKQDGASKYHPLLLAGSRYKYANEGRDLLTHADACCEKSFTPFERYPQ